MIASATPSSTGLARRITQRAAKFKDIIGLSLGNFIAASCAAVVGTTLVAKSVTVTHDKIVKDTTAEHMMPVLGKADVWLTTLSLVLLSVVASAWLFALIFEKTLLLKERASADKIALVMTAVMCASIATFFAMNHLEDIGRGLNWLIYKIQSYITGVEQVITTVPDNLA